MTFDLANTIFAFGVLGYGFSIWMTDTEVDNPDAVLGWIRGIAGFVVALLAPWLGSRTDFGGRRLPTLAATTLLAVGGTVLLGLGPQWFTFVALGLGLVGFTTGSAIYDALLPDVSTPATRGRVSGLGVGVGYVGSFVGLGIFILVKEVLDGTYAVTFLSMGVAFLFFSIPTFLFVREPPRPRPHGRPPSLAATVSHLVAAWRRAHGCRDVVRFLIARFLYTDALTTLLGGFLTLYALQELGFAEEVPAALIAVAITAAIPGGLIAGRLVERYGPRRVLRFALILVVVAIALAVVATGNGLGALVWVTAPLGGAATGMLPTADRVLMARISPPQRLGEFYGLYATIGRFSAIVGPLMWALVVDHFHFRRSVAMGVLMCFVLAALWVLRRVDDGERQWDQEDRD